MAANKLFLEYPPKVEPMAPRDKWQDFSGNAGGIMEGIKLLGPLERHSYAS